LHHLRRLAEKNLLSLLGNCRATGVWLALGIGALRGGESNEGARLLRRTAASGKDRPKIDVRQRPIREHRLDFAGLQLGEEHPGGHDAKAEIGEHRRAHAFGAFASSYLPLSVEPG
jgi:hypothetical protein